MVNNIQMIGCSFLPIDKNKEKILISKRSKNKKYFPNKWEVLGGNLDFGENFEDCIRREIKEEINCSIAKIKHLHSRAMYLDNKMYVTISYIGYINGIPEHNKNEISEIKWISKNEIDNYDFCPGDKDILLLGFSELLKETLN